uniref:ABC transporter domain-containing protein n=1 Tax=Fagus sylvatica TaxID=28930 RepID=A0A2N9GLP0_FAGSY
MSLFLLNPPSPPPHKFLKLKPKPEHFLFSTPKNPFSFKPINSTKLPSNPQKPHPPLSKTLNSLKPYLLSQHTPILAGWLCSLVSVFSLSKLVPKLGQFSSTITTTTNHPPPQIEETGFALGGFALVPLRRQLLAASVPRDLTFFEGSGAVSAGDIAYRITAEAADVADTVYALLNTIVPSTLQLAAMAAQMLMISPALSLISAMAIPCMALAIAYLGEKLQKISKRAHMSIATLSAYLNEGVGKAYNELKQGEPAIERLFDLTRFNSKVIEKSDAIGIDNVTGEVKFRDITFRYGDNMPFILNGLNLHVKAGETIALVGPSGGGKTTLAKLLLRLYNPLFGTVAENIGYRDLMTKIDMESVAHAAQTANAEEFIKKLPEGYNTNIGPRGSILSGGQKQRLALARALYQNSSILILDEATSALDSRSELLVRQAMELVMENHTVLVIAHRLETVLMAKRVFLLDDGKLEELTRSTLLGGHHDMVVSTGLVI